MDQSVSKGLLLDALTNRENFQYDVRKHFCERFFLCCCCCCWKSSLEERLFMKGQYKLHNEIDILSIIKQLRVAALTSQALLKPHQAMLVKWFDKYKVSLTQAERNDEGIKSEMDFQSSETESVGFNPTIAEDLILQDPTFKEDGSSSDEEADQIAKPKHVQLL